ncbi:uncharacterized protein LOC142228493 [Haematobia irritans]|uniref:uncharacterized protein LOC142228493 n=1 Tax=Haematobia irritans TaxID=7368 RepID=UPI003F504207
MSAEEEFSKWLNRESNTFHDNLKFAIKSWQSVEFPMPAKYEIILQWIAGHTEIDEIFVDEQSFRDLLNLKAQPGLITRETKEAFVTWCIRKGSACGHVSRKWPELYLLLLDFELLQDLYRQNFHIHMQVYEAFFISYENFLENTNMAEEKMMNTNETEFFASILNKLKETINRCGDVAKFENVFTSVTLKALVNTLLTMRKSKTNFFEEITEIEKQLTFEMDANALISRILDMPFHVLLVTMECSIVNRKNNYEYIEIIVRKILSKCLSKHKLSKDGPLNITMAAYILEMMSRHDANLTSQPSTLHYLGNQVAKAVEIVNGNHLKEILMLLCATLHFNPLILENHIFKITVKVIVETKPSEKEEQQLLEEYLVLLMDMFRRLSRAEKFVVNLLKAMNDYLKKETIPKTSKRKSGIICDEIPPKIPKMGEACSIEIKSNLDIKKYLNILFQDFFKPLQIQKKYLESCILSTSSSFPMLHNCWPSIPVGLAFSKMITGLVSKPSLVVWKTLLFALSDLIDFFKSKGSLDESDLFHLDFLVAMLSQYFSGCKLGGQSEKFLSDVKSQRQFTNSVMQKFGKFILEQEHQPRTMAAFLELSYYASCFENIIVFYRPDGCGEEYLSPSCALERFHSFLSEDEWKLIRQRVLNFGQSSCKYLLQRLRLQKPQSLLLLLDDQENIHNFEGFINIGDKESIFLLLKSNYSMWLISQMSRSSKISLASCIIHHTDFLHLACGDLDLLEFVSLAIYEEVSSYFSSKNSLLKSLSSEIDQIRQCIETTESEILIKRLVEAINIQAGEGNNVKKIDVAEIKTKLELLSKLPLGQLRRQRKTIIFALQLCLYRDLKFAKEDCLANHALEQLKEILHFGQQVLIFKYFPAACLLNLLPCETCWELYEFLFDTLKKEEKGIDQFLNDLAEIIKMSQNGKSLDDNKRKLLIIAVDTLSSLTGSFAKKMRTHLETFIKIFSNYLTNNFNDLPIDNNSKIHRSFVSKTLPGFVSYASLLLTKAARTKDEGAYNDVFIKEEIDDNFRHICKIYIGHSMSYDNIYALRLMKLALNYREILHLDQWEIEFVLTNYWAQITEDLQSLQEQDHKTMEQAVKLIIGNKTNEDLLLTLKSLSTVTNTSNILRFLALIAKCPFSVIKGAIFNEQYKQMTCSITIHLKRNEQQQLIDYRLINELLLSHKALMDNKMIPISTDTMDSIISFLMDINIKKFSLSDTNLETFYSLHLAMTSVCTSMIKQRHLLIMDRAPQFMQIFKDLLQSIVWYRNDRQKDIALPNDELNNLAELAMKLETLMHLITQHSVSFKRVAPFVLTFIINLIVANKRPTTLYNNIKTHVNSMCYALVGICDHRVGRFILRCSNEAGRQLYELFVNDYKKYHKFKGKM